MGESKGNSIDRILIETFASIHERGNIKQTLESVCIRHYVLCETECEYEKKTQHFRYTFNGPIAVWYWESYSHVLQSTGTLSLAWR